MSIVLRLPRAPEPLDIKAVIFDLDGLLVDSEGLAADAWRRTLASYGATVSEEEIQAMFGMRIVDDAALLIERHRLPTSSDALVAQRNDIMRALLRASLQPMPGAVDLVRRLSEHNVPLALATSAQHWYAEECLAAIGVDALFAVCVTGDDVTKGKPDP
ncbi:MAG TPA: HAD family phosphatase, partial [Ktedonobacterales bacterium]|nr:HAD family phosphatase [Ktedonobacterales bacterium]